MPGRDSYWDQTSLLINGNSTNKWDAGPNNLAVTTTNYPQRDSGSPFQSSPGYWSYSFDGQSDYLSVPSNAALTLGTGDFTIEFWINFSVIKNSYIYDQRSAGTQIAPLIWHSGSTGISLFVNGADVISAGSPATAGTWYHVAISRASGSTKLFINGTQAGSTYTDSNNYIANPVGICASLFQTSTNNPACYISNLRVIKGTALYTTTFSPPLTALTAVAGTSLLTCQDNCFKDNSVYTHALTVNGNVSVEPESPFKDSSVYFDTNANNNLVTSTNSNLAIGTGDFTVELWFKSPGNGQIGSNGPWSYMLASNTQKIKIWGAHNDAAKYQLYIEFCGADLVFTTPSTANLSTNVWHHIAVVRSGTTVSAYIDGTLFNSITNAGDVTDTSWAIGGGKLFSINNYQFYGYISNVRVVKGTALYTSNFTVPKMQLQPVSGTVLLTCQDQNTIVDNGPLGLSMSFAGTVAPTNAGPGLISYPSKKNSVYFDGTSDYIQTNNAISLSTNNFTFEAWIYKPYFKGSEEMLFGGLYASAALGISFRDASTIALSLQGSSYFMSRTYEFPKNTWFHLAVCKASNVYKIFLNGTQLGADLTLATSLPSSVYYIGTNSNASLAFSGYISNLRLVNGTALYSSNFAPSAGPLSAIASTALLACQSEIIEDSSLNNSLTASGTPVTSQFNPFDIKRNILGSVYFDGSSALKLPYDESINFSTGNFTIECFANPSVLGGQLFQFNLYNSGNTAGGIRLDLLNSGILNLLIGYDGSSWGTNIQSAALLKINSWYHIALTRSGSNITVYVNGASAISTTSSASIYNAYSYSNIGSSFIGYISNFRTTKASARYTTTFTPSLTHFQPDGQSTALIAGTSEVTARNKIFTDSSANNFAITGYGNATQATFSPYITRNGQDYSPLVNGGSVYFDGTGDYLALSNKLSIGSGDFTVECWYYETVHQGSFNGGSIFSINGSNGGWNTGSGTGLAFGPGNIQYSSSSSFVYPYYTNKWTHLAVTRKSGTLTVWINGAAYNSVTDTSDYDTAATSYPVIGIFDTNAGTPRYFYQGFVSDLRVVKGKAVYTQNFALPSSPLGLYSVDGATTMLLLQGDTGSIVDQTGNNTIEPVGDVKTSMSLKKYSNSAMYFDGNGDHLTIPSSSNFTINANEDFTIETWIYPTSLGKANPYFNCIFVNMATNGIQLNITNGKKLVYGRSGVGNATESNTSIPENAWTHVAVCRSGSTIRYFINGVLDSNTNGDSAAFGTTAAVSYIGNAPENGVYNINGYIDDFRFTKGVARYTSSFEVPSINLPTAPIYNQPVLTGYQDQGTDLGSKYVTKSYLMDWYQDLIPSISSGTVYGWGSNTYGYIGNSTSSSYSSPVYAFSGNSWKQVATGEVSSLAIDKTGVLWSVGYGPGGQLGDGTAVTKSSPVTVAGGGTWKQVACGRSASTSGHCAGIKTDGTLWTWGLNSFRQLGDATTSDKSSPVTTAGGGTNWKQVACCDRSTFAIKTDGTAWAWGANTYGQLGDGTTTQRDSPVSVVGGGNWKFIAGGGFCAAGIKTDGTLWTWGVNSYGGLGDGTTSNRSSPVTVAGGGNDWKQISISLTNSTFEHMAAIKQDGTLWTWGRNLQGQLGSNSTVSTSSPATVAGGGTNWKYVNAAGSSTYALKTDGTLWAWGDNTLGQLGDGTTTSRLSPVSVVGSKTTWKQFSARGTYILAISDE